MIAGVRGAFASITAWPVTICYLGAVAVIAAITENRIDSALGVMALGLFALVVILLGMRRELQIVHSLVNSQRDDLVERIDQLLAVLVEAGITPPPDLTQPHPHATHGRPDTQ